MPTIRPYSPDNWPRLCAIHDRARLDELRLPAGEAAFLTLEQTAENEGLFDNRLDVAVVNDDVVGFVAFSNDELTWLYVDPAHYGQGIGRALLRHAIQQAGPVFTTEVLEGNTPALNLYLSEGFRIDKHMSGRLTGNESFAASGYLLSRSASHAGTGSLDASSA